MSSVAPRRSVARASCTAPLECISASVLRVFRNGFIRQPQANARAEAMRGKPGTAGQRAHALPMQEPGQEGLGRADAPHPEQAPSTN
jgi:hypothetical protein